MPLTPIVNVFMDDVRNCPYDGEWMLARTVDETKTLLRTHIVDCLSLDHDMGACAACIAAGTHIGDMRSFETTFMNWCRHAPDGSALVRWMIEEDCWPLQKPTVHSANPVGAARMRGLIDRYWPERKV